MKKRQNNTKRTTNTYAKACAVTAVASLLIGASTGVAYGFSTNTNNNAIVSSNNNEPQQGGANTSSYDYTGSYEATSSANGKELSFDGEELSSTTGDTNVALAQNGGKLTLKNTTLEKTGDSNNSDNNNFYGTNSALLAVGKKSTATVADSTINTASSGSNGIFSTDSANVYASNTTISTTSDNSRGLDATYNGTIVANKMTISTKGEHSASLATDRGGGNVSVTNSSLQTEGSGSPLIYSTGNIQVSNVTGTATASQIAALEGYNTILINNSNLTSTNTSKTASDPVANGIIIYQSTSGDAETTTGETATVKIKDSTLKSAITSGSMFYLTNTTANVVLQNTTLDYDSSKAALLTTEGNDSNNWGSQGSNGATVTFTGRNQTLNGKISVDTISTVTLNLSDNSTWTGYGTITENSSGSTSQSPLTINIDGTSTWVVTKDTTVSNLNVANGGKIVDSNGKTVTIKANGKTVVKGDSNITVTVTGTYGTTVSQDSATEITATVIDRSTFDSTFNTSTTWSL
ncbi:MAG: adhesin [Bifidobacteriaceae bacterium]|nr:adhesin [Bifidobacteriaceae bacterium]